MIDILTAHYGAPNWVRNPRIENLPRDQAGDPVVDKVSLTGKLTCPST